jgi:hypothetical protein
MGFVCHRLFRRSLRRRVMSAMLAAMYIVTAAGIPLPAGNLASKSGELFPCSECACGCASAEQCWRSCCCHSLAERFEWAREHKVRPPEFAIAEARRARIDLAWLDEPTRGRAKASIASCCMKSALVASSACCQTRHCCCSEHHDQPAGEHKTNRVIGWKALNCQGHSANWLAAVPTLVHVGVDHTSQLPRITRLGPPTSEIATGISNVPTPPPPQRA